MPTYTVPEKDYARLLRQHGKAREKAVRSALNEAAMLGAEVVAHRVPVDEGMLKGSIHAVSGRVPEIVADAPHAAVIELGARPHWPPLAPLEEWVQRHAAQFEIQDESDVEHIAYLIARKISQQGSPPHWYMRNSQGDLKSILGECIDRALSGSIDSGLSEAEDVAPNAPVHVGSRGGVYVVGRSGARHYLKRGDARRDEALRNR